MATSMATSMAGPTRRDLWTLAATALLLLLAWRVANVLLLCFAGIVVALVLERLAAPLVRRFGWPPRVALVVVIVVLVAAVTGVLWSVGAGAAEQLQALRETLPRAWQALREWIARLPGGRWLLEQWSQPEGGLAGADLAQLAGLATGTVNAITAAAGAAVLVLAIGIYLAADPETYRRGLLLLVPPRRRPLARSALDAASHDLSRWLLGQGVSMAAVGVLTAIGLVVIGMPLVFPLALASALLDFVPYFGPWVSGVLIVAVALTEGEGQALAALAVVFAVQQAEAWLVQPLAQRWAVRLQPVLGLLAVIFFGVLFGIAGVLLAVPLMVVTVALVRVLVIERREGAAPSA